VASAKVELSARVLRVLQALKRLYPDAHCALDFKTPFELLCATVLSAQCTDARVNKTTPELFSTYPTPEAMARASLRTLERLVRSTGFYKNKALSLKTLSEILVKKHGGEVPRTLEELTELRGVGRKTANVLLGNAFGIPGMVVDTHVGRLSRRLGFTRETDPVKVEYALMELIPREDWTLWAHLLISHGRAVCDARKPRCDICQLKSECPQNGVLGKPRRPVLSKGSK
jgi:endonuclease-3